jgi:hypothetical protein
MANEVAVGAEDAAMMGPAENASANKRTSLEVNFGIFVASFVRRIT